MIPPRYSSVLTASNSMFCPNNNCHILLFYYRTIQINVSMTGSYTFAIKSTFDAYGYMYNNSFNSSVPNLNRLLLAIHSRRDRLFMFTVDLQTATKYILVATTYYANVIGPFSLIVANGAGPVTFVDG